jgi:hypothetical protein
MKLELLVTTLKLMYLEYTYEDNHISVNIVNDVMELVEDTKALQNNDDCEGLLELIREILGTYVENGLTRDVLLDKVLRLLGDTPLYINFKESIVGEVTPTTIKQIRSHIIYELKLFKLKKTMKRDMYTLTHDNAKVGKLDAFIDRHIAKLEELRTSLGSDEAVVDEVDIEGSDVDHVIQEIKNGDVVGSVFQVGWKALNDMFQGGLERGTYYNTAALAHNYKTGLHLSLFTSIVYFNTPVLTDPDKKPLALAISFEDPLRNVVEFIFNLLHMTENDAMPKIEDWSTDAVKEYIAERLQRKGFHVKLLRVNPTEWTFRDIINKVREYETQGYEVQVLALDYLTMLPTIGCNTSGPTGTDVRDLIRRVRNFCASKNILCMSPVQLGPRAKNLLREGTPALSFVKEAANKGYYSGSAQLDQEFDLSVVIHKAIVGGKAYLTIHREKHRKPTTIPESKLFTILPFPDYGPIPFDLLRKNRISMDKIGGGEAVSII